MAVNKFNMRDVPHLLRNTNYETSLPGYIKTITDKERDQFFVLWRMLIAYLSSTTSNERRAEDQLRSYADDFLSAQRYPEDGPSNKPRLEIGSSATMSMRNQIAAKANLREGDQVSEDILRHELCKELFGQSYLEDLDCLLLRFLRARKWVIQDAFSMLVTTLQWRVDYGLRKLLTTGESDIPLELRRKGKGFLWERDLNGRLVGYVRMALHDKNKFDVKVNSDHLALIAEASRYLRAFNEQSVTIVLDCKGIGMAALDLPLAHFILRCMQYYYPETLGTCLIVDAPWIFLGFWRLFMSLLDPVMTSKVFLVNRSQLKNYIAVERLPIEFGGACEFHYHYREPKSPALTDEELDYLFESKEGGNLEELQRLCTTFLNLTLSGNSEERKLVKQKIRLAYYERELPRIKDHEYVRLGIMSETGVVDWNNASSIINDISPAEMYEELFAEGRSSAPPF